jgi:hypothetical protein
MAEGSAAKGVFRDITVNEGDGAERETPRVIARERSDDAIQAKRLRLSPGSLLKANAQRSSGCRSR